jgi:glycosyltransferase involved in cell wall biosynthesis
LPRSLLEAAACGRPIVTTKTPGCGDFISRSGAGLVVPADDAVALAEALRTLAGDAALRQRLGAAARAHVEAHHTLRHASDAAAAAWRAVASAKAQR